MTPFMSGFGDELEKLAIVGAIGKGAVGLGKTVLKHPFKAFTALLIGGSAVEGAKQARKAGKTRKSIRPSRAYYTNYSRALGIPRGRMSKLQEQRLFSHARSVPGRYRK
jgi:hypothetical protein